MKNVKNKKTLWMILTGLIIGAIAVLLVANGNPKNMGFCIACFIRDIAGGVGMHQAAIVQYIRPEIIGLVLGALIMSVAGKEFKAQGGSSPVTRFVLGFFVMVGALMFLGCPLRMVLRIAGGDLNAVVGLVGFVVGILAGIFCLNQGFSLRRTYEQSPLEGGMISAINVALLVLVVAAPPVIYFSTEGPGSMRAPLILALVAGLVVGAIAQRMQVARMLAEGNTYESIRRQVPVSSSTITRINTELRYGSGGYQMVLDRLYPDQADEKGPEQP